MGEAVSTLHSVSIRLDIDDNTVYSLAARGWLASRRRNRGGYRYVAEKGLRAFVATPRCWLVAPPHTIPDPDLRAVALEAQRATPGRWWSSAEIGLYYNVYPQTVSKWRRAGWGRTWEQWGKACFLWAEVPPPAPVQIGVAHLSRKAGRMRAA
jgi:hypothetical protein